MDDREHAALVSGFDQRLSHWRSRLDAGATGGLHALERFRLRRDARPRAACRSINLRRGFPSSSIAGSTSNTSRSLAGFAKDLGHRDARRRLVPDPRGQMFKLHTQTSGRSLIAAEFKNNLTRTAAELMLAYMNGTNSCHSNSADEPFTTPSEEWIRLAAHGQAILLEESGIFKHTMNMLSGSPGMKAVERAVEKAILDEFREIESLRRRAGARLRIVINGARSKPPPIVTSSRSIAGTRPIVGVDVAIRRRMTKRPRSELARTPRSKQQLQVRRLQQVQKEERGQSEARARQDWPKVVESDARTAFRPCSKRWKFVR